MTLHSLPLSEVLHELVLSLEDELIEVDELIDVELPMLLELVTLLEVEALPEFDAAVELVGPLHAESASATTNMKCLIPRFVQKTCPPRPR